MAVAHGGEASTSTNGFWASLNIATTERLPLLYFIEDNGYGISVPATRQTPGGNIAANLAAFGNLKILSGDGADPLAAAALIDEAVATVRGGDGPVLLRLRVPRLSGHSGQDTQAYKSAEELASERARDPLAALRRRAGAGANWQPTNGSRSKPQAAVGSGRGARAHRSAARRSTPRRSRATSSPSGTPTAASNCRPRAASAPRASTPPAGSQTPRPEGARINMLTAIRRTLEHELAINPRVLVFGEDVGRKGGVHAATLGLQERFGEDRVFDTSLSEEGIIGRAVGMALAGLVPVPEIQFRKYAEPAAEQLHDCGTIRWRTANRFAAPMVVRMPGGFFKCGDPWHSQCNEVAVPARYRLAARDAVERRGRGRAAAHGAARQRARDLLRAPLPAGWRGGAPSLARRRLRAAVRPGEPAARGFGAHGRELGRDGRALRRRRPRNPRSTSSCWTCARLSPWDREAVLSSVAKTRRCLIVHEDNLTAGFGAEIAAMLAERAFFHLDAPIERLAMPDIPSPHAPRLLDAVVPAVGDIVAAMRRIASI